MDIILVWRVSFNVLHVSSLFFTNCSDYNLSTGFAFFRVHTDTDKMVTAFKAIITPFWIIFGYFLQPCFFSWKFVSLSEVISRRFINMKLRFLVISIVSLMLFLHKHIKTPDHYESIRSCSKHEYFTFDYIDTCENIQSLETQLTINYF